MVLAEFVSKGLNRKYPTIAASLDFTRAFDTVWQDAIVYKMMSFGFDVELYRITANFFRNCTFSVRSVDTLSGSSSEFIIRACPLQYIFNREVRLLIYKQIVTPLMSYVFQVQQTTILPQTGK